MMQVEDIEQQLLIPTRPRYIWCRVYLFAILLIMASVMLFSSFVVVEIIILNRIY